MLKELLSPWPIERPKNWTNLVNAAMAEAELDSVRRSIDLGAPNSAAKRVDASRRLVNDR